MRVLGIDPGTNRVGIGVVSYQNGAFRHLSSYMLSFPKNKNAGQNLLSLERALEKCLRVHRPDTVGVERLFFSKNKKTALSVSEARGVILKTIAGARLPYEEITPSEVKLFLTGSGSADKRLVARMVEKFLKKDLEGRLDDETDALAIAIAAAFRSRPIPSARGRGVRD